MEAYMEQENKIQGNKERIKTKLENCLDYRSKD